MTQAIDLYAVMGNPIEHSLSPLIHQAFAKQCQQVINFEKRLVDNDHFPQAIQAFINEGGKGLSITLPFKQRAYNLVDEVNEFAQKARAVNNIIISQEKKLIGVNTDGIGLVNDIQNNLNVSLNNKNILIMGAGGAVRGALQPILNTQPKEIIIANRTVEKAELLALEFSKEGDVTGCGYQDLIGKRFDIIINGTAASIANELPPLPNQTIPPTLCYDMMYSKHGTPFLEWAKRQNTKQLADGIGMLIEQGAEIFFLWRGVKPDTAPLLKVYR